MNIFSVSIITTVVVVIIDGGLLITPENSWAKDGDTNPVSLKCKAKWNHRLNWIIKTKSSPEIRVFDGYRLSSNVRSYCKVINDEPGKYELNLTATSKAAQKYICHESYTWTRASAELIIIESDPECNGINAGERTILACRMVSHGNWAPAMECRNGNSGEIIGERAYETSSRSEDLTSSITVPTNDLNVFSCTTKFRLQEKPSDTTASNVPDYHFTWVFQMQTTTEKPNDGIEPKAPAASVIGISLVAIVVINY